MERNIPWWKTVLIHALIAAIRTSPEPTVFAIFDCLDEVLAHFVGRGFGISVLA